MNIRNPGQDGAGKGSAPENTGAGKAAPVHMYRVSLLILFFMMGSVFGSWASRIPDIKRALSLSDGALGLALFAAPTGEFAAVAVAALLINAGAPRPSFWQDSPATRSASPGSVSPRRFPFSPRPSSCSASRATPSTSP